MSHPPPRRTDPNNFSFTNTLTLPSASAHNAEDEPISPLSQTFNNTTKAPPQSLTYLKPSTLSTTANWNDLPLSWAHPTCTRPQTSRSSSSTGLDINALYATANPRVAPRKRLSSMINTKGQTSVSAPTTPMTSTSPAPPPPYQDDVEWRDVKGNVERGERGSVSGNAGAYAYGDEERTRRRARRRRTIKGVAVFLLLITLGVLGLLVKGGPLGSSLSSFEWMPGHGYANGEGGDAARTFWGMNMNGMPSGGQIIEKCKAMSWRPKMPEFLAKYFSAGDEEMEIQTIIRTIRLMSAGKEDQMSMTVSRVIRGKGPLRMKQAALEKVNDRAAESGGDAGDHGHDSSDQLSETEEEAHRARAAEMWEKHDAPVDAPVAPPEDSEHGHQTVLEGHEM